MVHGVKSSIIPGQGGARWLVGQYKQHPCSTTTLKHWWLHLLCHESLYTVDSSPGDILFVEGGAHTCLASVGTEEGAVASSHERSSGTRVGVADVLAHTSRQQVHACLLLQSS